MYRLEHSLDSNCLDIQSDNPNSYSKQTNNNHLEEIKQVSNTIPLSQSMGGLKRCTHQFPIIQSLRTGSRLRQQWTGSVEWHEPVEDEGQLAQTIGPQLGSLGSGCKFVQR